MPSPLRRKLVQLGFAMPFNSKVSSPKLTAQAAATLRDTSASSVAKSLAASVLSQAQRGNQTGKAMEATASKVLHSSKYSDDTKALAASVLSQSNKER